MKMEILARNTYFIYCLIVIFFSIGAVSQAETKSQTDAEIERVIRNYILKNPEIILNALQKLEADRNQKALARRKQKIQENHDILFSSVHQSVIGNRDGDITLVKFFDYNCGFCRQTQETVEQLIATNPTLRVVLKEFPVLGAASQTAARVSIAAAKVDSENYATLHKRLFKVRGAIDENVALALTRELHMNVEGIKTAMTTPQVDEAINEVYQLAVDLGIDGTPSFILGDELIAGAVGIDVLQQKIDALRECGKTECP